MLSMLDSMAPMPGLPPCLYYMMPLENFRTVRKHGLVSRSTAMAQGLHIQDYSDLEVQSLHIPADHEHQFRFNVNTIS
ncbi:hypothetical protein, partial [Aeromonas caviae]|uniref:hypothetical protein n=1 Tax=Aeromonas caviae TaxID=648 RepID=UPI003754192C